MTRVFGIIPAAGQSRRMGAAKQLLSCGDSTLLETVIGHLLAGGLDGLCVVTRSELVDALHLAADARLITAINDDPDAEMIDSIVLGVRAITEAHNPDSTDGFMVCPGDMPRIGSDLVARSVSAYRGAPGRIAAVVTGDRPRHPVIVPFSFSDQLESLRGKGLKRLIEQHRAKLTEVDCRDEDAQIDIDSPADYQQIQNPGQKSGAQSNGASR